MDNDNNDEDLVIEVDNEEQEVIENANDSENENAEKPETDQEDEQEEDRVVTIGEPEVEEEAEKTEETAEEKPETPGWVKTVRKSNRRLESEVKRLKRQLEEKTAPKVEEVVDLGEEPTIASCGYDDVKYRQELRNYDERKRKVDQQKAQQAEAIEVQNKQWQSRQEKYVNLRKEHSFKDFQDAEELVSDTFNQTQQGIIIQGADDAALLVYALGKNPKKLEELSKIKDPVDFAFKLAKLESQLKVTSRKAPRPEKRISGNSKAGGVSGNGDKTLERLRSEAAKTGDFTAVTAYKRKLRE